jgi:glyceraldehyde-3-phosphate dehydrogenase/erythrose-4-phosphate dehydrogenase
VPTKVAINGFGRIGRQVLKAIYERHPGELEVVAINDLVDVTTNAHLLKYDSNYGRWAKDIRPDTDGIAIDGKLVKVHERDPAPSVTRRRRDRGRIDRLLTDAAKPPPTSAARSRKW